VSITIRISFKKYTSSIIVKENFSSNVYTAVAKIIFVGLLWWTINSTIRQ